VADLLMGALFDNEDAVIEWNRIGCFQDVTMRLIAEQTLPNAARATTYVQGELINRSISLHPLVHEQDFYLYCSAANPGAAKLAAEVADAHGLQLLTGDVGRQGRSEDRIRIGVGGERATGFGGVEPLRVSVRLDDLPRCEQMLVYLTDETWTGGERSAAFASEVKQAMEQGISILLAHEMLGVGGQEARHAVDFGTFFSCEKGATPQELLQLGIYNKIAIALKGGDWRKASMVLMLDGINDGATGGVYDSSNGSVGSRSWPLGKWERPSLRKSWSSFKGGLPGIERGTSKKVMPVRPVSVAVEMEAIDLHAGAEVDVVELATMAGEEEDVSPSTLSHVQAKRGTRMERQPLTPKVSPGPRRFEHQPPALE